MDTTTTAEPAEAPATDKPLGAQMLLNCIEHLEALETYLQDNAGALEPDSATKEFVEGEIAEVIAELKGRMHEHGAATYEGEDGFSPDTDMEAEEEEEEEETEEGQVGENLDETEAEEDAEEEAEGLDESGEEKAEGATDKEEEEKADEYTHPQAKRIAQYRKRFAQRKAYRLKKGVVETILKGCDHMEKSADHLDQTAEEPHEMPVEMHKGHAAMLRKHAAGMRAAVGGEAMVPEGTSAPEEGPHREDVVETKSVDWSSVLDRLNRYKARLRRTLGS